MALALADLDRHIDSLREARAWAIGHAINGRMGRRGYAWLSVRLLLRDICHCSWPEGQAIIRELLAAGEFYQVTAPGRGPDGAVAHTLYFKGWAHRDVLERELRTHNMPLEAFLHVERCFKDFRARVSFFAHRSVAGEQQHSPPQEGGTTKKDGRSAPDRPLRASHDPPPQLQIAAEQRPNTPSLGRLSKPGLPAPPEPPRPLWNPLNHHGQRLRELREKAHSTADNSPKLRGASDASPPFP